MLRWVSSLYICLSKQVPNLIKIRPLHLLLIVYRLFTSRCVWDKNAPLGVTSVVTMNIFGVYRVRSKTHMIVLSAGFCRRVVNLLIYNTFMLIPDFC
jgi:hypothetical protein